MEQTRTNHDQQIFFMKNINAIENHKLKIGIFSPTGHNSLGYGTD